MEGALLHFNFASHSGICEQYLSAHKRHRDGRERQRARAHAGGRGGGVGVGVETLRLDGIVGVVGVEE